MTIIFEKRKVNDKELLVQFQFDTYNIKVNGSQVDGMSLDKYIGLDVWSQIYTKLEGPLERYKSNIDTRLKEETIQMRRAQLELRVLWRSKQAFHREIANIEEKKCDLCPYVMVVKIGMVSFLDKFKKQHSQDKLPGEKTQSQKSTVRESDGSNDARTSNGSSSCDVEEYVPAGTPTNSLKYTPSTVSSGTKSDEYTPTQSADDIVTYTPTKIDDTISYHRDQSSKHKATIKTDVNRNDYPIKKKRTDNTTKITGLFGGDSDESNGRQNHNLRPTKKATPTEVSKDKQQQKIHNWVNTSRPTKKYFLENGNGSHGVSDDIQKKRKINEISPIESAPCNKQAAKDEEAKKLRALREQVEREELEKKKNRITYDTIINLKDMPIAEIIETFPEYETVLRRKARSYAKIPDQKINPIPDDYLLILDGLVESDQQKEMCRKLTKEFGESDPKTAITSNHENLIWKVLLPEWALNIFMTTHFLTQDGAMERLRNQDTQVQADDNSFDSIG